MRYKIAFLWVVTIFLFTGISFANHLAKVQGDQVNVRSDSTILASVLGKLEEDQTVEIIGEKFEWYKIRLPKQFICYAASEYIKSVSAHSGTVTARVLNLRNRPSLESAIIGKIKKGSTISILKKEGDWIKAYGYPYLSGWVHKKFIQLTGEEISVVEKSSPLDSPLVFDSIIQELSKADMAKKHHLHEQLVKMGLEVVGKLETYLNKSDKNTSYSIIVVLSKIGKSHPQLISKFLTKINPFSPTISGAYLDIIQDILQPEGVRKAYFALAQHNRLTFRQIERAKWLLRKTYIKYTKKKKKQ